MFGSDGLPHDEFPHPRLWGTFPRILGHYARDVGLFTLEEGVRRMTSLSAAEFGRKYRGEIAEGKFADICGRSAEHTSELQSPIRSSSACFCFTNKHSSENKPSGTSRIFL